MRDTKKMSRMKIDRFNNICKLALGYFFIGVISFHLFIVFMKIKNLIFQPQ